MLSARGLRRLHLGSVDFDVEPGGCLAIRGASGAGKSVLLRMVADLDPHDGEVTLDGAGCSSMPAPAWRRQVAYVAADSGWWKPRVGDHFTDVQAIAAALSALDLSVDALSWPVARLSTGERQRLSLLRAVRPETRVLLLDEPTSGLDLDNVTRVEQFLTTLLEQGAAIVMVTHDAGQAARIGTQRRFLRNGRLEDVT